MITDLDKIQLRDLSKYKISLEEKLAMQQAQQQTQSNNVNDSSQNSMLQNQTPNSNPPLPPRGQTPHSHRQSLSQFQPKSLYAHKDPPPPNTSTNTQLPFQQQNYMPPTPTHYDQNVQYNSQSNFKPPHAQYAQDYTPNQTDQIHSQNATTYKSPSQYQMPSKQDPSNAYHASQQQRPSMDQIPPHLLGHDQIPPQLQPKPQNYLPRQQSQQYPPNKNPPNHYPASNSSQYQYTNSMPGNNDGYRQSVDYSAQQNVDKTAYTNRMNSEANESYQRHAALRRNSKPVSGESPYSFKQVSYRSNVSMNYHVLVSSNGIVDVGNERPFRPLYQTAEQRQQRWSIY